MTSTTKVIFYLLFIPYVLLVMFGVINAFNGISVGFFGDQSLRYGTEAFLVTIIFILVGRWYIWGLCLLLQIASLVIEKIKNKGAIKVCIISMMVVYIMFTLLGYGLSFLAD